jgi:Domain of unknown function (DUF4402)
MKKLFIGAAIVAAVTFTQAANAQQQQSTASANALARIVSPILITKTADLNFGDVVPSGAAGTVTVTPAGSRSALLGATLGSGTGVAAAGFNVTGQASATYAITLPASPASITDGASHTMSVGSFVSSLGATGTLSGTGSQALTVGATLNVLASQAAGSYTGSFSVSVNYN